MDHDRRKLRRGLAESDPNQWTPALDSLLEAVAGADLRDLARSGTEPGPAAACPSLTRHRRAALRHDWAPEELAHVEGCPRCRRTRDTVSSALWHPEVALLAGRLSGRLGTDEGWTLEHHLAAEGCRSCRRLLGSPWLRDLAAQVPERGPTRRADGLPGRLAFACVELPRAVGEFATGTRPPFHLRAVASRGNLVVVLRETDQGQLVVHVETPHSSEEGQKVRVELLGDGEPLVADVELAAVEGEPGCIGRHAFGPFVELVPSLRPAIALLAVLAEKGAT